MLTQEEPPPCKARAADAPPAGGLCSCASDVSRNLRHGGVLARLSVLSCWTPQGGLMCTMSGVRLTGVKWRAVLYLYAALSMTTRVLPPLCLVNSPTLQN